MREALVALISVALVLLPLASSWGAPPRTERISVSTRGVQGNGDSDAPSISADGQMVVFQSTAMNLVEGDDELTDVFMRNRVADTTRRVSLDEPGAEVFNGTYPQISADARVVAYTFPLLGEHDAELRVYDAATDATETASVDGADAISANGRFVATTCSCFLEFPYVSLYDRAEGREVIVSVSWDEKRAGNRSSYNPSVSAKGRFVAFVSTAANLVRRDDTNGKPDIFVRDRQERTTARVSVGPRVRQSNGHSALTAISADGRFVAFTSAASNLVAKDTNGKNDVFVRDREAHRTFRVSVDSSAGEANGDSGLTRSCCSHGIAISGDGRFVAFVSQASDLVAGDTNGKVDVFVRDRERHRTFRVSVASSGEQANGDSAEPAVSESGYVAFSSEASNLASRDTNQAWDVFVHGPLG